VLGTAFGTCLAFCFCLLNVTVTAALHYRTTFLKYVNRLNCGYGALEKYSVM
jgi:hypothetical protein